MKNLKSLMLSHPWLPVLTPKMALNLAKNCHQLEKISISGKQVSCVCDELGQAFQSLIENNVNTLKDIKINVCKQRSCSAEMQSMILNSSKVLEEVNLDVYDHHIYNNRCENHFEVSNSQKT